MKSGTLLGSYEILAPIGVGGMGEVYRARDSKLGREVAIKILREELAAHPERLKRFEQEARTASALNHPNIVHIYEVGEHENLRYISMEYVEGKTLRTFLNEGPLPSAQRNSLAAQIAEGLAKAHLAGIVHRDLKPENLMVTSDGYVKILDFGLAKLQVPSADADSRMETVARDGTTPGTVMGTVGYMSPEQVKGQTVDFRTDHFSFGAILYEMVAGKRAFEHQTTAESMSAILRDEPDELPNHQGRLLSILRRCLAKNPLERYASTQELARDVKELGLKQPSQSGVRSWKLASVGAAVVLVLVTGVILKDRLFKADPIDSLAVLPFENLSGDPEQEYFVDGMTEAVISNLAKIGSLKVISRTSVMRYKDSDKSLPEIGRELDVDAVVEGSVLRAGDQVRITAQLIDAEKDQNLWAESYERELRQILSLQGEVARAIASEIQLSLSPHESASLSAGSEIDPKAYEAYLKGRFYWNKQTVPGFERATEFYREATKLDPEFAPAYAGLADASLHHSFFKRSEDLQVQARTAALKAIDLDQSLGDAHASLAAVMFRLDWDWKGAEKEFLRALELSPQNGSVHFLYSRFLTAIRHHEQALLEAKRALELDPVSVAYSLNVGDVVYHSRRFEEAIDNLMQTYGMDPDSFYVNWNIFITYMATEQHSKALNHLESMLAGPTFLMSSEDITKFVDAKSEGNWEIALEFALSALKKRPGANPFIISIFNVFLSRNDESFEWLEVAFEQRDPTLVWVFSDPIFDPLRSDPRFQSLLQRMNFPKN